VLTRLRTLTAPGFGGLASNQDPRSETKFDRREALCAKPIEVRAANAVACTELVDAQTIQTRGRPGTPAAARRFVRHGTISGEALGDRGHNLKTWASSPPIPPKLPYVPQKPNNNGANSFCWWCPLDLFVEMLDGVAGQSIDILQPARLVTGNSD